MTRPGEAGCVGSGLLVMPRGGAGRGAEGAPPGRSPPTRSGRGGMRSGGQLRLARQAWRPPRSAAASFGVRASLRVRAPPPVGPGVLASWTLPSSTTCHGAMHERTSPCTRKPRAPASASQLGRRARSAPSVALPLPLPLPLPLLRPRASQPPPASSPRPPRQGRFPRLRGAQKGCALGAPLCVLALAPLFASTGLGEAGRRATRADRWGHLLRVRHRRKRESGTHVWRS